MSDFGKKGPRRPYLEILENILPLSVPLCSPAAGTSVASHSPQVATPVACRELVEQGSELDHRTPTPSTCDTSPRRARHSDGGHAHIVFGRVRRVKAPFPCKLDACIPVADFLHTFRVSVSILPRSASILACVDPPPPPIPPSPA